MPMGVHISGYNTFVKTAAFLLLLPAVRSQPLRVYSEFAKIDAAGRVTAPAEPREILSPAIARNAFSSFQVVVDVPRGTSYQLYVAQNPENAVEVTLYRENGEKLERVEQPVSGNATQVFWMDLWTARDAPVARIKVEPQLHVNNDWVIYPMEARVMEATVPDGKKTGYSDSCKSFYPALRSRSDAFPCRVYICATWSRISPWIHWLLLRDGSSRVKPLVKVKMIPSGIFRPATTCFACVRLKKLTRQERRDGRVAEGARLESVFRGNSNQGSNPCLSAILFSMRWRDSRSCVGNPTGSEYCSPKQDRAAQSLALSAKAVDLDLQRLKLGKHCAELWAFTKKHDLHLFVVACKILHLLMPRRQQSSLSPEPRDHTRPGGRIEPLLERNHVLEELGLRKCRSLTRLTASL